MCSNIKYKMSCNIQDLDSDIFDIDYENLFCDEPMDIEIIETKNNYTIEEDGDVFYFKHDGTVNINYWELYSNKQRKNKGRVLNQFKEIWFSVYCYIDLFNMTNKSFEDAQLMVNKIYNIFFTEMKFKINYYSEDMIKSRKSKNFKKKKLYRISHRIIKL